MSLFIATITLLCHPERSEGSLSKASDNRSFTAFRMTE